MINWDYILGFMTAAWIVAIYFLIKDMGRRKNPITEENGE